MVSAKKSTSTSSSPAAAAKVERETKYNADVDSTTLFSYRRNLLSKQQCDIVRKKLDSLQVVAVAYRGGTLKRSPKYQYRKDASVGVYKL